MKKLSRLIALIFMMILLAGSLSSCLTAMIVTGNDNPAGAFIDVIEGIGDAIEEARFKDAAKEVIKYDEVDTF